MSFDLSKRLPSKGVCAVCGRGPYRLLADGRVGRHGSGRKGVWPPEICEGWGELAKEILDAQQADATAKP